MDAGRKAGEEVRVAAIQRQLADQPGLDPLPDGRGRRLNSGELLLDFDARGHVADLEPNGEVDLVLDSEDDSVADKALEHGAEIINDPSGVLLDLQLPKVVTKYDAMY